MNINDFITYAKSKYDCISDCCLHDNAEDYTLEIIINKKYYIKNSFNNWDMKIIDISNEIVTSMFVNEKDNKWTQTNFMVSTIIRSYPEEIKLKTLLLLNFKNKDNLTTELLDLIMSQLQDFSEVQQTPYAFDDTYRKEGKFIIDIDSSPYNYSVFLGVFSLNKDEAIEFIIDTHNDKKSWVGKVINK